jgi:hypothetical protein
MISSWPRKVKWKEKEKREENKIYVILAGLPICHKPEEALKLCNSRPGFTI